MAKGDYYFKLFYKRLLTSTIGWKDDEFGAYMRLLIHQFDNDNRIPNDLDELQLIAPSIKKNWKRIGKKFKDDGNGMLYNEVMSDEYSDVQNKKQIRSEFGKLGGRPKKQKVNQTETKEKPKAFDLLNQNESYPITNNQEPIVRNREARLSTKVFNAEEALLANPIEMGRICVVTGRSLEVAKWSLHKYHLHLEDKEEYPKSRPAIFAGFEKWLMDERNNVSTSQINGNNQNPLRKLTL